MVGKLEHMFEPVWKSSRRGLTPSSQSIKEKKKTWNADKMAEGIKCVWNKIGEPNIF